MDGIISWTMNYRIEQRIERIESERWFMQCIAHQREFLRGLHQDTEQMLFHRCLQQQRVISIINDCFNRIFAGVNGFFSSL